MNISNLIKEYISSFDAEAPIVCDGIVELTPKELIELKSIVNDSVISNNAIVGINVERSAFYIGIYLILLEKGITVVPLSTDWNNEFKNYVLSNSRCTHIITSQLNGEEVAKSKCPKIEIELYREEYYKWDKTISYIIFTSGSTGRPKGVCISKNALEEYAEAFNCGTDDSTDGYHLITGEITFDIIIADLIIALKNNKAIYITRNKANIFEAAKLLLDSKITSGYFVPSLLQEVCTLLRKRSKRKRMERLTLYSGGEKLTTFMCQQLFSAFPNLRLYNMYGPTESTVNCLGCQITQKDIDHKRIPTGYSFKNMNYFFNNLETPCSPGKSGELLLSGPQLMEGYVGPGTQKEGIICNHKGDRYYATGDIFYMDKDKKFYFKGRVDAEVKLKGNRVNLSSLEEYCVEKEVGEVIVFIVKNDLLYCFIYKPNCSADKLRQVILKQYPSFCVPHKMIDLKEVPRNKNGKLDKLQLIERAR